MGKPEVFSQFARPELDLEMLYSLHPSETVSPSMQRHMTFQKKWVKLENTVMSF